MNGKYSTALINGIGAIQYCAVVRFFPTDMGKITQSQTSLKVSSIWLWHHNNSNSDHKTILYG